MIGSGAMGSRALGQAGLPDLASEWGGPRPAAAGGRGGGRQPVKRGTAAVRPRR